MAQQAEGTPAEVSGLQAKVAALRMQLQTASDGQQVCLSCTFEVRFTLQCCCCPADQLMHQAAGYWI
jgi:hypothetical protein